MTFLITGATGRTSAGVVRHLRAAGADVRALVRDREKAEKAFADLDGVEILDGAFDDGDLLARAFDGVEAALLAVGSSPDQIRLEQALIDGAAKARLPHLVKLSSIGAGPDSALLVGRLHAEIESHLAASGLPHTLLRPASFSNNLLMAAAPVAAAHSWAGAAPTGRVSYIDIRDLSEATALVLRDPALQGGIHDWTGPDAYTAPEVAELLSRILGHAVSYREVSAQERRSALAALGTPEWFVELRVSLETGAESGQIGAVTTALRELLGREPRTVEEFLTENAALFGAR
ncbi:NmrA family NAD(P)-binding protein [Streptacidiphilus sp. N1-12]|uniref:NmrA family NAD(P)-binding protein n=2 Tax=Streptacidiphilus alkalitolerans TaxID=3342712 RepID=A0ABV6VIH4_9ACTN